VGTDPTSIWERGEPRLRRPSSPGTAPATAPARRPVEDRPTTVARITLLDASQRYGVSLGTLRAWSRAGEIDAIMSNGPGARRWLATPASLGARLRRKGAGARTAVGPTANGNAMLVPRDAWDRLVAQLGNLHQAGQELAEARERAARAETEATFLRDRLSEMRQERDGLRQRLDAGAPAPAADTQRRRRRLLLRRRPRL